MNLKKFLFVNDICLGNLAAQLGIHRGHLSAIINGRRNLTQKMAQRIEDVTDRKIKKEELLRLAHEKKR